MYVVLRNINKVFYIDVGANDPTHLSVTRAFYERGGNGINIEPLRDKCRLLEEERVRDINLCIGAGEQEGELEFVCAGTGSTFSKEIAEEGDFGHCARHNKKVLTLTQIYQQYCSEKQEVHFCKIDVEGFEREVLKGCDFNIFRPWIFLVEAAKPGTNILCYEKWEGILLSNDYILAYSKGINRYYVDRRKEYLIEYFANVESFIYENEIIEMQMYEIKESFKR